MTPLLSATAAEALAAALLHFLWQGAAVACLTALALLLFTKADSRIRYALACGGLTMMLAAFLVTIWLHMPGSGQQSLPALPVIPAVLGSSPSSFTTLSSEAPFPLQSWLLSAWIAGVSGLFLFRFAGLWKLHGLTKRGVCAAPGK